MVVPALKSNSRGGFNVLTVGLVDLIVMLYFSSSAR